MTPIMLNSPAFCLSIQPIPFLSTSRYVAVIASGPSQDTDNGVTPYSPNLRRLFFTSRYPLFWSCWSATWPTILQRLRRGVWRRVVNSFATSEETGSRSRYQGNLVTYFIYLKKGLWQRSSAFFCSQWKELRATRWTVHRWLLSGMSSKIYQTYLNVSWLFHWLTGPLSAGLKTMGTGSIEISVDGLRPLGIWINKSYVKAVYDRIPGRMWCTINDHGCLANI